MFENRNSKDSFIIISSKTPLASKSQMDHNEICKAMIADTSNGEEGLTQND